MTNQEIGEVLVWSLMGLGIVFFAVMAVGMSLNKKRPDDKEIDDFL